MAGCVNKVILVGNVGQDPDIRNTQSGSKIATLSLATTESWKDQSGQKQDRTEWHRVVVFGDGLVNIIENYVKKGHKIYIEGQLQTRKWQDQQGNDKYTTEVVISGFNGALTMLGSPNQGGGGSTYNNTNNTNNTYNQDASTGNTTGNTSPQTASADGISDMSDMDDDIPF